MQNVMRPLRTRAMSFTVSMSARHKPFERTVRGTTGNFLVQAASNSRNSAMGSVGSPPVRHISDTLPGSNPRISLLIADCILECSVGGWGHMTQRQLQAGVTKRAFPLV